MDKNSNGIYRSSGIYRSNGIFDSRGLDECYGLFRCQAVYGSIFCSKLKGKEHFLFNKQSTPERILEIKSRLEEFRWYPVFTKVITLGGDWEWADIDPEEIAKVPKEEAWAKMPKEMLAYIKSLPEFDIDVFEKITGIKIIKTNLKK